MQRLVLFAKTPRLGTVKTRLVPPLGAREALFLYEAMLLDQLAFLRSLASPGRSIEVCLDRPGVESDRLAAALDGVPATLQGDGPLGSRLMRALDRAFADGALHAAALGADAPTLPRDLLEDALARLDDGADAAVVPALDGGYVLIATRGSRPELFEEVPWGDAAVLEVTEARAAAAGLSLAITGAWGDVDRASDIPRLRAECLSDPSRAPLTAAVLERITVV